MTACIAPNNVGILDEGVVKEFKVGCIPGLVTVQ